MRRIDFEREEPQLPDGQYEGRPMEVQVGDDEVFMTLQLDNGDVKTISIGTLEEQIELMERDPDLGDDDAQP